MLKETKVGQFIFLFLNRIQQEVLGCYRKEQYIIHRKISRKRKCNINEKLKEEIKDKVEKIFKKNKMTSR